MTATDTLPEPLAAEPLAPERRTDASDGPLTRPGQIARVLLATDLGPASELATDWAFELAVRHAADLLVVSVIDPRELRDRSGRGATRWDHVRDVRHDAALQLVARGRTIGVRVSFLVWTGDPGESIVSAADAESADVVVVGTHARGTIGRLLIGSVSEHVVRHASCPVLVVRPIVERIERRA